VQDARLLSDEIAAAPTTDRVRLALHDLNLGDDLANQVASQQTALAALDRLILGGQWAQADRFLKYLREAPPAWMSADSTEVKTREVKIRLGLDQRPAALSALRDLTLKPGASRSAAFRLVRDTITSGDRDSATLLAREIARLLPDEPAAARLLKEAEAPRPAN
jgi:hypothetical protein